MTIIAGALESSEAWLRAEPLIHWTIVGPLLDHDFDAPASSAEVKQSEAPGLAGFGRLGLTEPRSLCEA